MNILQPEIICLAAAAVLYLLVVKLSQRSEDADSSDDSLVISSVDSGQITAISYEKDGKSLSFRKEDGTWYNAEDKSFPVDQDSLTTMTNAWVRFQLPENWIHRKICRNMVWIRRY